MTGPFPLVPLGGTASPVVRPESPMPGTPYRQIGVKLWGQGAYEREPIDGSETQYKTLSRVEADDIVVNKIWARNGSVAVVTEELAGCYGSGEFPTFAPDREKLEPRWIHWLTKTRYFWDQCDEKSRGTSGKNRIRPEQFLAVEIPLPPLAEQRRIVGRIEALAAKIAEARGLSNATLTDGQNLLLSVYAKLIASADWRPMRNVAPLVRRPVVSEPTAEYLELGVRSFGKGTFHKAPVSGASLGDKRIFSIRPDDLLFNIVFAWEGAVAVARPEDEGRVGSHRFLTCVPQRDTATSPFLCFHFLTEAGLRQLGEASPGGAGRNRTLGLKALESINVPVPPVERQRWFDSIQARIGAIRRLQAETAAELDALLPAVLDRAFKGGL